MKFAKILLVALALACMLSLAGCSLLGGGPEPEPDPDPNPGTNDTCEHVFTEKASSAYLCAAATCESPATYFKSCKLCGVKSTDTFLSGKAAAHKLVQIVADEHVKFPADCSYGAEYYMTCSVCGQHSEETFMDGEPLTHNFQQVQDRAYMLNGASCTQAARYYESCTLCGAKSSTIFTVGHADGHHFETVEETAPTATAHGKVTHKVCTVCTLTFDLEENSLPNVPIIHSFSTFFEEEEGEHFHACLVDGCVERTDVAAHTYGADCDAHCNVCELTRTVEADHADENGDGFCDVCAEPVLLPEPPKEDDTSDFDPF